jgi:ribosomal protein S18 acetylase RimI-like enzyme
LLLAQALAPACQRRAVERRLMTEAQLAAEELEIRIELTR